MISDYSLPAMTGTEPAQAALALRLDKPFLLPSGDFPMRRPSVRPASNT